MVSLLGSAVTIDRCRHLLIIIVGETKRGFSLLSCHHLFLWCGGKWRDSGVDLTKQEDLPLIWVLAAQERKSRNVHVKIRSKHASLK